LENETVRHPHWYNTTKDDGNGMLRAILIGLALFSTATLLTHFGLVV
jgi:hypothetical protein